MKDPFEGLSNADGELAGAAQERYMKAAHAMQSGVAMMMNYDRNQTDPKHMRVGVNSALVDSSALASLLIEKGIITWVEYFTSLADHMEHEVKEYTDRVRKATGARPDQKIELR